MPYYIVFKIHMESNELKKKKINNFSIFHHLGEVHEDEEKKKIQSINQTNN